MTRIVCVCTGNTCRSPLAEALCKKLLAERLGCPVAELPQRGYDVQSAGLAVILTSAAAAEAVAVAQAFGADLSGHVSRPLTEDAFAEADFVLAMTQGHLLTLQAVFPELAGKVRLLSPTGEDISDPIGGDREVYEVCARQIQAGLEAFVANLLREQT